MSSRQTRLRMTKKLNYFSPTGKTYTSDPRSKEGAGDDYDHRRNVCGRDVGIDAVGISSTTNDPAEPGAGQADHGRRLPPIRSEGPVDNGRHQRDADWHLRNAIEPDRSTRNASQNDHLYPHAGMGRQFEDAHRPDRGDHWY